METGKLTAYGESSAGIGGINSKPDCGTIIINSGKIEATGGATSPGIGGCSKGYGGDLTINGGTVEAKGRGDVHAAIGKAQVILPEETLEVGESAFEGDPSIRSAEIPEACQRIGKAAFRNCVQLEKIRIPAECELGEDVFAGCGEVYVYGTLSSPAEIYCRSHENCVFVEE